MVEEILKEDLNTAPIKEKKVYTKKEKISEADFAREVADLKDLNGVFNLLKKIAPAAFNEAVDCAFKLIVKKKKTDKVIRGFLSFPHSVIVKKPKIAVFASGEDVEKAKNSGADFAGLEDLIAEILGGQINYDYYVATKSVVGQISSVAKILKGLMPNLKLGTVTDDVTTTCKNLSHGIVQYRDDKQGIVHAKIGYKSFTNEELKENFMEILRHLYNNYNNGRSINEFFSSVYVQSTMSCGIPVSHAIIAAALKGN
jgi:large subunit ribosomal protein L1